MDCGKVVTDRVLCNFLCQLHFLKGKNTEMLNMAQKDI